jgi:alkylation response protein AidB-like acyl-CoA dehydrogenase
MEQIFATERLAALLPQVKAFVLEELVPLEKDHTTRPFKQTEKILEQKREKVKALGLWNLHLPKEEGGQGLTLCEFGQISEALSLAPYYGQYTFNCQAPDIGNTTHQQICIRRYQRKIFTAFT